MSPRNVLWSENGKFVLVCGACGGVLAVGRVTWKALDALPSSTHLLYSCDDNPPLPEILGSGCPVIHEWTCDGWVFTWSLATGGFHMIPQHCLQHPRAGYPWAPILTHHLTGWQIPLRRYRATSNDCRINSTRFRVWCTMASPHKPVQLCSNNLTANSIFMTK